MADFSLAKKAVELALDRWGRLDALVVNHGTLDPVKKVADGSVEEWRGAFDVNVFSAVGLVSLKFSFSFNASHRLMVDFSVPVLCPA